MDDRAAERSAPARDLDVVVLGAGPAGTMAALTAARAGARVVLVDAAAGVGGMAASIEVAGQRVDLGSHRLHRSIAPDVLAELRALPGLTLQARPRRGRIRLAGRWLGFPLRPLDLLRHAPPALALGFARDLALAPLRRPRADTFAELVRSGPGPTLLREFYEPYARKLWALPATELDGELFRRRVSAGTAGALVRRVLRGRRPEPVGFWYPERGFGAITEALATALEAAGGRLALGQRLVSATHRDGTWDVTTTGGRFRAPVVVSTLPARVLADAAAAPPEVRAAAAALHHRGGLLVYLVHDQARYTGFDAHYFPGAEVGLSRLSEPKNYRDGPDPAGHTVLCAELSATVGDAIWSAPDAEVAAAVVDDLARSGLPPVALAGHHVVRLPHVYPVYTPGFAAHQAAVERWAATRPGLVLTGRQALFAHDNTHHALEMGAAAGRHAAAGAADAAAWAARRESFRAHVVED